MKHGVMIGGASMALCLLGGCYLSHGVEGGGDDGSPFNYFQCSWDTGRYMVLRMCADGSAPFRRGALDDFSDPEIEVAPAERLRWIDDPRFGTRVIEGELVLVPRRVGIWRVADGGECEGVESMTFDARAESVELLFPAGDRRPFGAWPAVRAGMTCPSP